MKHNTRYKEEVVVKTKSPLIRKKKTNDLIHSENSLKRPSTRTSITAVDTPLKQRNISQKGNKAISELKEQIEKHKKILAEKMKENEKIVSEISNKNKELMDIKTLSENVTKTIVELEKANDDLRKEIDGLETSITNKRRALQSQHREAREVVENYLRSLMMSMREENNNANYPNPDNMTYEELLELEERMGNVSKGLTEEKIKSLPQEWFKKGKYLEDKCVVCQYEFKDEDKVKVLPCKHCFHPECIDEWLKNQKVCPFCKKEIS